MLKYTRWIAPSAPIESPPPLRMWWTVSVCTLFSQHLPGLPGSHQQVDSFAPAGQAAALRQRLTLFAGKGGALRDIDQRVDGAGVVHLVVGDRRGVGGAGTGMGEDLPQQIVMRHTRNQHFGHADVLVADQAGEVFPLRMLGIERRFGRVKGDVAGGAGGADQEWRFDRGVGQLAHFEIGAGRIVRQFAVIAFPAAEAAVESLPGCCVEARIGKLAEAERAGGGAESEVAAVLAALLMALGIAGIDAGVLEVAGRIAVARLADELQQGFVAGAPVEAVGFLVDFWPDSRRNPVCSNPDR